MGFKIKGKVAPSILAADFMSLLNDIRSVEASGADLHHFDVMDGHYVPNLTFGPALLKQLKASSKIPIDVHLMVTNPDDVAVQYVESGADIVVFHIEVAKHSHRLIQEIHQRGAKAGVALNPSTPVHFLKQIVKYVDVVNLMSVNPGFSGQKFIPETTQKIRDLVELLIAANRLNEVDIEVDGGIDDKTAELVCAEGANILVAGTFVYGSNQRADRIDTLKCTLSKYDDRSLLQSE